MDDASALLPAADSVEIVLAALYLRGLPRTGGTSMSRWRRVESALLRSGARLHAASEVLADAGLYEESVALREDGLLSATARLVKSRRVCTAGSPSFPSRWSTALGRRCPAALWRAGEIPIGRYLAVVGARRPTGGQVAVAREIARGGVEHGFTVVSGGAMGVDRAAAEAARAGGGNVVEILPRGLGSGTSMHPRLALCAPREPMSVGSAMERNRLIYAAATDSVVIGPRFREGGSWHGALDALRHRWSRVWVFEDGSPGSQGLVALGALPFRTFQDVAEALTTAGPGLPALQLSFS